MPTFPPYVPPWAATAAGVSQGVGDVYRTAKETQAQLPEQQLRMAQVGQTNLDTLMKTAQFPWQAARQQQELQRGALELEHLPEQYGMERGRFGIEEAAAGRAATKFPYEVKGLEYEEFRRGKEKEFADRMTALGPNATDEQRRQVLQSYVPYFPQASWARGALFGKQNTAEQAIGEIMDKVSRGMPLNEREQWILEQWGASKAHNFQNEFHQQQLLDRVQNEASIAVNKMGAGFGGWETQFTNPADLMAVQQYLTAREAAVRARQLGLPENMMPMPTEEPPAYRDWRQKGAQERSDKQYGERPWGQFFAPRPIAPDVGPEGPVGPRGAPAVMNTRTGGAAGAAGPTTRAFPGPGHAHPVGSTFTSPVRVFDPKMGPGTLPAGAPLPPGATVIGR